MSVLRKDTKSRIQYANAQACEQIGKPIEDLKSNPLPRNKRMLDSGIFSITTMPLERLGKNTAQTGF